MVVDLEKPRNWGPVGFVFMNDRDIKKINNHFLGRDRITDVIAFTYAEKDMWGEILIDLSQASRQAMTYHVPFHQEVGRLLVHGLLHVMGYEDAGSGQRLEMKKREDDCLARWSASRRMAFPFHKKHSPSDPNTGG